MSSTGGSSNDAFTRVGESNFPEKETHAARHRKLRDMINRKYPKLGVETLLMALDGTVEAVD